MMMLFVVKDSKAGIFTRPFFLPSIGAACRFVSDLVVDRESPLHAHPSDYSLWELGSFEEQTGVLVSHPSPKFILEAQEYVPRSVPAVSVSSEAERNG